MEKEKRIVVDFRVKKQLLKLGTYPTIRKALDGDAGTPQRMSIRDEAIKLGGVMQEPKVQEKDTLTDSSSCTPFI